MSHATGITGRETAVTTATNLRRGRRGHKNYDTRSLVVAHRWLGLTPHVANITDTPVRSMCGPLGHVGDAVHQEEGKRAAEVFGWVKTVALLRKTRHRGVRRVGWLFALAVALYSPERIRNVIETEARGCAWRWGRSRLGKETIHREGDPTSVHTDAPRVLSPRFDDESV